MLKENLINSVSCDGKGNTCFAFIKHLLLLTSPIHTCTLAYSTYKIYFCLEAVVFNFIQLFLWHLTKHANFLNFEYECIYHNTFYYYTFQSPYNRLVISSYELAMNIWVQTFYVLFSITYLLTNNIHYLTNFNTFYFFLFTMGVCYWF